MKFKIDRRCVLKQVGAVMGVTACGPYLLHAQTEENLKPNIILIVVDDLNTSIGCLSPQLGAKTPNIDRLASQGTLFSNAHCTAPACNASRTSLLTGLRPSTSGIYDNSQAGSPDDHIVNRTTLLPDYLKKYGYTILGGGKIPGHSTGRYSWDATPDRPKAADAERQSGDNRGWNIYPGASADMPDWHLADWAVSELGKQHSSPFFLAVGFVKPHTPWSVPKEYFDRIPVESVTPPPLKADEVEGIPAIARTEKTRALSELLSKRREAFAAYLAACAFADDCVGRVMAALETSAYRNNTIVILCGDNGFGFGEKNTWGKGRLWAQSTRVPLIIAGAGLASEQRCSRPASLMDIYPTLVELCRLPPVKTLEGASLTPLLKNPNATWEHAAITTAGCQNHAVCTERWRYIRYADGAEELYDHSVDNLEWKNLAGNPEYESVKADLRRWLPSHDAPRNPDANKRAGKEE
jgi:arylsulfatase A-like enzyme